MAFKNMILCCLITSFFVHYGWRMRGTVVGGEKGAMLPGIFAGMLPALFAGGQIKEYFLIPAAAGLIGMSYGGIEPYGDSIAWIEDPDAVSPDKRKGYLSLALKGALWFSVAGGFIGLSFYSVSNTFSLKDVLLFIIGIVLLQFLGYVCFNQPYNKEKGIHPKIYLSYESRDEWGSNVGVLTAVIVFAVIKQCPLAVIMSACGFVFGAVGWCIAMILYHYTEHPKKNGKYLFGKLAENKLIGGWGNMEYCLGSFGGFGLALGFCLGFEEIRNINEKAKIGLPFSPIKNEPVTAGALIFLCLAVILFINIFEYLRDKNGRKYNSFIMDLTERPFFNTLPFALILPGSVSAAKLMSAFMLIFVLFIKCTFNRFKPSKARNCYIVAGVILLALTLYYTLTRTITPVIITLSATLPYIISEVVWCGSEKERGGWNKVFSLNGFSFNIILLSIQAVICLLLTLLMTGFGP